MRRDRGIALLEVLIAIGILGTAGLAVIGMLRQASVAEAASRMEERTVQSAGRVLSALTLLGRAELDQRIGLHPLGEFAVEIQRPEAALYRVAVSRLDRPERTLLVTVVYRAPEHRP